MTDSPTIIPPFDVAARALELYRIHAPLPPWLDNEPYNPAPPDRPTVPVPSVKSEGAGEHPQEK